MNENKEKALATALAQIHKAFGTGSIMRLGDKPIEKIEAISTRSLKIDDALGIGGLPKGRIIELYGPESSGKSTLATQVVAECQSKGGVCAYVDAEHALDPSYAEKLGVNIADLLISQPDNGEQALEITEQLVRSGAVDLVIVDSVAALTPKSEIEGEMGDSQVGKQARLMSQALRKLTAIVSQTKATVIFINQIRMKIGQLFGNPETTTGGNALKFYASVRIDIRRTGSIKVGEEVIGNETKVKIVKNKVAPPFREVHTELIYGEGISLLREVFELAVEKNVIEKSGAWYSYNGERIGQGKEKVLTFLKENPHILNEIKEKVVEILRPKDSTDESETVASEKTETPKKSPKKQDK